MTRIGLISDTHGLLRPEALAFLAGSDHILHGGDIGGPEILDALRALAPVTAVRGNNDREPWADALPDISRLEFEGVHVWMVHDLSTLRPRPTHALARVVVHGHSHKPRVVDEHDVLYVNPGSAGPRRFSLPVGVGELLIDAGRVQVRNVELDVTPRR